MRIYPVFYVKKLESADLKILVRIKKLSKLSRYDKYKVKKIKNYDLRSY